MSLLLWGILSGILAAGFAVWSYYRLPVRVPSGWLYVLGTLRALAVWALCFMLGEPVLSRYVEREEKPQVVILADNSESVFWGRELPVETFRSGIEELRAGLEARGLHTVWYAFDDRIRPADSLNGTGQRSLLSAALRQALDAHPRTAAVLLLSDGQENGEPLSLPTVTPVWTVGVGPKRPASDIVLESVEVPPWITEKQAPVIQVRLRGVEQAVPLVVRYPGGEQRTILPAGTQRYTLTLPPLPPGFHLLQLQIEDPGDPNPANNQRRALLEVQPEAVQVFLWAGEITPDIAFLRARLERIGRVRVIAARKPSGYTISPDTLRWKPGDLHILYNFPARPEDEPWAEKLFRENAFLLLSWGAIQVKEPFLRSVGLQRWSGLTARSFPGGATLYLHTIELPPPAQPLDPGWGHPVGYKLYQGNKLTAVLLGEGWWRLREAPVMERSWDSLLLGLLQEGVRLQRSRWLFAPRRNPLPLGEAAVWSGFLPAGATLSVAGSSVPLRAGAGGMQEAIWMPDTPGVYPYIVSDGKGPIVSGALLVEATRPELQSLGRDTTYLRFIARATGGHYIPWEARETLIDSLSAALPVSAFLTSQRLTIPFYEWSLWLALILSLLSAEWLLRRYVGLY